jgi:ABC-type transport system involved in multi-copper enzyme maturation permease subunit
MPPRLGGLHQLRVAFLYQLRSYFRTRRFVGFLLFVTIVAAAILGVQLHRGVATVTTNDPTASAYLSAYLSTMPDVGIITEAFLGGDALAVDFGGGPDAGPVDAPP